MIPEAFLRDLLARTDIVSVVGAQVPLKKTGANLMGLCPFHGEKSPSFSVSPAKQFYHCFGCGASGDALKFLTELHGMTFREAVDDLAQQAGLTVPEEEGSATERAEAARQRQRRATLSDVLARAADGYRKQLRNSPRAIDYLKGRGLSGEIASRFGLGYAPDGWRSLASLWPDYDDPLLEESGLVIAQPAEDGNSNSSSSSSNKGNTGGDANTGRDGIAGSESASISGPPSTGKRYDRFRDRIMFPIRSVQGEVIGFGGRVLDRGEPKYLNSPETPVFSKGRELYGLFEARSAMRDRGHALVVEGYMDVVALAQSGFGNAVATLGTACTADHLKKLFRFTDSVVFAFDGDAAGRRAAVKALQTCLPYASDTRTVRFLFLPAEHDPDSFVRERGNAAFEQAVATAVPLSRQIAEVAGDAKDLQTAEGRAHLLADARPLWSALPDGALKRQLLSELAALARMETAELRSMWGDALARPAASGGSVPPPGPAPFARRGRRPVSKGAATLLDRAIWLLLHRCEMWTALDGESHDMLAAQAAPYDMFFSCIERSLHEHGPIAAPALLAELRARADAEGEGIAVIGRIADFHDPEPGIELADELALVLDKLRLQAVEDELTLLFAAGAMSADAQARSRQLSAERSRLKAEFARRAPV